MDEVFLALDTSTPIGSVAVGRARRVLAEVAVGMRAAHAETLLPSLDFALRSARVEARELSGVIVSGGPGSFTGVRIAAATAKGLVHALGVPLFAYSGLLAQAACAGAPGQAVCALFDARRGEVYAGCWRFPDYRTVEPIFEPAVRGLHDVLDELNERMLLGRMRGGDLARPVYAGEGAQRHHEAIEAAGGVVAPAHLSLLRASALLWLREIGAPGGRVADPFSWEPQYLRESGAERVLRERAGERAG